MIFSSIQKEFRLVLNDLHSMGVLLIMPILFMIIMTFAMSSRVQDVTASLNISVIGEADTWGTELLQGYISDFGYHFDDANTADIEIHVAENFETALFQSASTNQSRAPVAVKELNTLTPQLKRIVSQHIQMSLARTKLHLYLLDTGEISEKQPLPEQKLIVLEQTDNTHLVAYDELTASASIISHSIPAWLVFGIYFIALPLSITLVSEQQSGTLIRIKTFPISNVHYFSSKLLSFFLISLLQGVLLAIIGFFLIPKLVNEPTNPWFSLVEMLPHMMIVSASAVAFGALIATKINSYEQAIVLGGGINIILASLSGLMVPIDIMPEQMQALAKLSPMYWAALGFREIHNDGFSAALPALVPLVIFATFCGLTAFQLFDKKMRYIIWK